MSFAVVAEVWKIIKLIYLWRFDDVEARTWNNCWSWNAISITYSKCVFAAFCIQYAMRMRHIAIRGLSGSTVPFPIISHKAWISKVCYWTQNECFDFFKTFVWNISHSKKNWARYDHKCIRLKYPVFWPDFNVSWIFSKDFRKALQCQIS
jgi:hypothetical protein